jgi:hypothetical protein
MALKIKNPLAWINFIEAFGGRAKNSMHLPDFVLQL